MRAIDNTIRICILLVCIISTVCIRQVFANEYKLVAGDLIRVTVFNNSELTVDLRVDEDGTIKFPLIGSLDVVSQSMREVEGELTKLLIAGGFVREPQINIMVLNEVGNQISVLGYVNRPGRYPVQVANLKLTDVVAMAGGIASNGGNTVVIKGKRDGKDVGITVDIPSIFTQNSKESDPYVKPGDVIYVDQALTFYIYGEVQRPGAFPLRKSITVMQAIATGGGMTPRGSNSSIYIYRQNDDGVLDILESKLTDPVMKGDVLFLKESLF